MAIIYGAGRVVLTPLLTGDGTVIANPTPIRMRNVQNISGLDPAKFDSKLAYGQGSFAMYAARGKTKMEISFEALTNTALMLDVAHGQGITAGSEVLFEDTSGITMPTVISGATTSTTITPPNSGTFLADMGVYDSITGIELVRVASSPAAGQYTVSSGGVYTLHSSAGEKTYLFD